RAPAHDEKGLAARSEGRGGPRGRDRALVRPRLGSPGRRSERRRATSGAQDPWKAIRTDDEAVPRPPSRQQRYAPRPPCRLTGPASLELRSLRGRNPRGTTVL